MTGPDAPPNSAPPTTVTTATPDPETRFAFGRNWRQFLENVDEVRVQGSVEGLRDLLGRPNLAGLRFLDVGSGSGLSSLAALRMGAEVQSFDYDPEAVECTLELRRRLGDPKARWQVRQGSALDRAFLSSLGTFDIVYSWGVLHHTGAMHEAMANVAELVRPGGQLYIAIYNDEGRKSNRWRRIKRWYVRSPRPLRSLLVIVVGIRLWARTILRDTLGGHPLRTWQAPRKRGMSAYHDLVDWVGGYPFEVATPNHIVDFFTERGFRVKRTRTPGGLACNEFVFSKQV